MKIAVFTYDFPHQKSVEGLLALALHGYKDVICIGAPKKQLAIKQSKIRVTPIIESYHPKDVAHLLGYQWVTHPHDDPSVVMLLSGCDVSIVLGARILKSYVVNSLPIINMHPGLLPHNRGLDNIKWAILDRLPQGVTTHIIDSKIDVGILIDRIPIDVYPDDTLLDIYLRIRNLEIEMMIEALKTYKQADEKLTAGHYYHAVPPEIERHLMHQFDIYRHPEMYQIIKDKYLESINS